MGSKGSQTTSTSSSPNPAVLANLTQAQQQAQNVASTPFNGYNSATIAGLQPLQQAATSGVTSAAGLAQPYIGQAGSLVAASTSGVNPTAGISNFMNPYQSSVVNAQEALEGQQDAQQQQQVVGNATAAGAFGGDRATIAQTSLAGQQALANNATNSNLLQSGYNTALNTNLQTQEANAQLAQSGAYALGQLGSESQSEALSGLNAENTYGTQEQQLAQEELNAPYQAYEAAQSYPYQVTNFLAGVDEATGSLEGGNSSSTSPGPSTASGLAGLGTLGLGVAALAGIRRGGRIGTFPRGFDAGGLVSGLPAVPDLSVISIPNVTSNGSRGSIPGANNGNPGTAQGNETQQSLNGLTSAINAYNKLPSNNVDGGTWNYDASGEAPGDDWSNDTASQSIASDPAFSQRGGRIGFPYINPMHVRMRGYDEGGGVTVDDYGNPIVPAPSAPTVALPVQYNDTPSYQVPVDWNSVLNNAASGAGRAVASGVDAATAPAAPALTDPYVSTDGTTNWHDHVMAQAGNPDYWTPRSSGADAASAPDASAPAPTPAGASASPSAPASDAPTSPAAAAPGLSAPPMSAPSAAGLGAAPPAVAASGETHDDGFLSKLRGSDPNWLNSPAMGLVAAGLGIMGGTSKFPLVNIGQGGLQGVKYLQDLPKMQQQTFQNDILKAQYNYLRNAPGGLGAAPGSASGAQSPLGMLLQRGRYMIQSPFPDQVKQGAEILKQVNDIADKGIEYGADGQPHPIPGIAEYKAQAAALLAAATKNAELPAAATLENLKAQRQLDVEKGKPRVIEPGATLLPNGTQGSTPGPQSSATPSDGGSDGPWRTAVNSIPDPQLRDAAVSAANRANMPDQAIPYWVAAVQRESGWNPNVPRGTSGEIGLGQVMPGTGAMLGYTPQDLTDPGKNLEASARYFTQQWQAAKGDPSGALRGYNGGSVGNMKAQPYADDVMSRASRFAPHSAPTQTAAANNVATDASATPVWKPPPPPEGLPQISRPLPDLSATTTPVPQARRIQNADGSVTMAKNPAFPGVEAATTETLKEIPKTQDALIAARGQLAGVLDSVRRNANAPTFLQSGWAGEARQDAAKAVNQILAPFGIQALSPNDIANNEAMGKDSTRLAFELARTMGSRAPLGELNQANRGVPNIEVTRFGNLTVANMLLAANNREYDRNAYVYDQARKGGDPLEARQTFDRINPPERYVGTALGQAAAEYDPRTTALLKQNPTPERIAKFDKQYGAGAGESLVGQ